MKQHIRTMKGVTPVGKKEQKGIRGGNTCTFECLETGEVYTAGYLCRRECPGTSLFRCLRDCGF